MSFCAIGRNATYFRAGEERPKCSDPSCDLPQKCRGYCNAHYLRAVKAKRLVTRDQWRKPSNESESGADDTSGERCKCGLRLPCNDCLPATATEYAFTRMYAPNNWPEGEHRTWTEPAPKTNERERRAVRSSQR